MLRDYKILAVVLLLLAPHWGSSADTRIQIRDAEGETVGIYKSSFALVIGNSEYTNGWSNLESIPEELNRVEQALISQGFNVERHENLDANSLSKVFENFVDTYGYRPENRLLFFYSGHGYSRDNGKKGYLVPTDAPDPIKDEENFLRRSLNMTRILSLARDMEANHGLFLFDSCFSGTIFKSRAIPKRSRYITKLTAEPVRQFITSGSAGETVPAKSVFTPAFVDAIEHGLADLNQDGFISGTELGLFLQETVTQFLPQTPQYGKINDYDLSRGDFIFVVDKQQDDARNSMAHFLNQLKAENGPGLSYEDSKAIEKLRSAFEEVVAFSDTSTDILQVRRAWDHFLTLYSMDLPTSNVDNTLRDKAQNYRATLSQKISLNRAVIEGFTQAAQISTPQERIDALEGWLDQHPEGEQNNNLDLIVRARAEIEVATAEIQHIQSTNRIQQLFLDLSRKAEAFEQEPKTGIAEWSSFISKSAPLSSEPTIAALLTKARQQRGVLIGKIENERQIGALLKEFTKIDDGKLSAKRKLKKLKQLARKVDDLDSQLQHSLMENIQMRISSLENELKLQSDLARMQKEFEIAENSNSITVKEAFLHSQNTNFKATNQDEQMRQAISIQIKEIEEKNKIRIYLDEMEQHYLAISGSSDLESYRNFLLRYDKDIKNSSRDDDLREEAARSIVKLENIAAIAPTTTRKEKNQTSILQSIYLLNQLTIAKYRYSSMIRRDRVDDAFLAGIEAFNTGQNQKAIELFSTSIQTKATKNNLNFRGVTYHTLGHLEEALEDYTATINMFPNPTSSYNRGTIFIELNRIQDAINDLENAETSSPTPSLYNNLAVAYALNGQTIKAIESLNYALKITESAAAYNNRGLLNEIRNDFDAALSDYQKAASLNSSYTAAKTNLLDLQRFIQSN